METVSDAVFAVRVIAAFVGASVIGFVCGYYGPIYLLSNPGVAPITGYFLALPCGVAGGAAATYGCVKGYSRRRYFLFLAAVLAAITASSLAIVL